VLAGRVVRPDFTPFHRKSRRTIMGHAPLPSVPKTLLRFASLVNDDASIPSHLPSETTDFLHRLGTECDHSVKPLGRFLLLMRASDLVDEVMRILTPAKFCELRKELERTRCEMEGAVASEAWERVPALKAKTDGVREQLLRFRPENREVRPAHVLKVLENLGYDQPIAV